MRAYGVAPDHLIVVHDELDIEPGTIRVKFGGGHAGHNGLRSICDKLGTRDWFRVRIGIGRPPGRKPVVDWVLSRPRSKDDTRGFRSRGVRGCGRGAVPHRQRAGEDPAEIQLARIPRSSVIMAEGRGASLRSFVATCQISGARAKSRTPCHAEGTEVSMHLSEKGHTYALFAIVVITCALGSLTQTVMNSMLTEACDDFAIDAAQGQWVTTIYMLAMGVTVPVVTYLARRFSLQRSGVLGAGLLPGGFRGRSLRSGLRRASCRLGCCRPSPRALHCRSCSPWL